MLRRRYLLLEFLQDNEGKVYAFMYDLYEHKCLSVPLWQWLENLDELQKISYKDDGELCQDCPFYEEENDD